MNVVVIEVLEVGDPHLATNASDAIELVTGKYKATISTPILFGWLFFEFGN